MFCVDERHISHWGEWKSSKLRPPNSPLPVLEHTHYSTGARQLQQHQSGDWRWRETGRESKDGREGRERRGQWGSIFIFLKSCLSLNGGKEAKENCVERRVHANYFITLAHSRLLKASDFCVYACVCVCVIAKHSAISTASLWLTQRPWNTSSHCNIFCFTDVFFCDIFSNLGLYHLCICSLCVICVLYYCVYVCVSECVRAGNIFCCSFITYFFLSTNHSVSVKPKSSQLLGLMVI